VNIAAVFFPKKPVQSLPHNPVPEQPPQEKHLAKTGTKYSPHIQAV